MLDGMPPLGPVAAVPAHELVLEQLRRSIHLGHFGAGAKLPSERELARLLSVSRTTVREAVRVLEAEELVEIRRGSSGGIVVRSQPNRPADLRRRLREFEEIIEYRLAVEPMVARLAAERRTRTDLVALGRALRRLEALAATGAEGAVSDWVRADGDFHLLIARLGRNAWLARAVEDARAGMFLPIGAVWGRLERRAHDMHREIHDAIVDGDPERAAVSMAAHVESTRADIHAVLAR
jgi:GntR family transcriptional regulator, transcriptional repressor for pyruvate dehydrogenase complex